MDNIFSSQEWSAATMVDPDEIRNHLYSLGLVGRKIKSLRFVGMDYAHSRDFIEDIAYHQLKQYEEEERHRRGLRLWHHWRRLGLDVRREKSSHEGMGQVP